MPDLRLAYLSELERTLSRSLTDEDVALRIAEIDAHLQEGIEGRQELGLDREAAERDAVAAFGDAKKVANGLVREAFARRDAVRLRWLGAAFTLFVVGIVMGPPIMQWSELGYHSIFVLAWICVGAFGIAAFRARRPAPIPVLITGLGATFLLCVLTGTLWLNLGEFGGIGSVGPYDQDRNRVQLSDRLTVVRASQATLAEAKRTLASAGIEAFKTDGGYRGPELHRWYAGSDPLKMRVFATGAEAEQQWLLANRTMGQFDETILTANIDAMDEAMTHPLRNFMAFARQAVPVGVVASGLAMLLDLVAGGLGMAWLRARRGRRSGGLLV